MSTDKYVLIKADQAGRGLGYVTHALDCRWVGGGNVGRYERVPVSKVPKDMGRCRHCGGGR